MFRHPRYSVESREGEFQFFRLLPSFIAKEGSVGKGRQIGGHIDKATDYSIDIEYDDQKTETNTKANSVGQYHQSCRNFRANTYK